MIETLPLKEIDNECKKMKIAQQTVFGAISLTGAILIAIIYDGETLLPIIGILGATVGAIVGPKLKGVKRA